MFPADTPNRVTTILQTDLDLRPNRSAFVVQSNFCAETVAEIIIFHFPDCIAGTNV